MIFLVQVENDLGLAEDQLYTFGYNNLNALGTQANLDAITPWNPIALRGKTINQIGCGGYHTMFLCGTQVYCVGYNANGELGTGDSTGIQDVKEMTWLKEPIRHISCGHFSTVFITTDNRILVTGCNEGDSLGVGQNFKGNPYVFNVQEMKQFDFITENIFVGGYHWFVKTIRNDLYYTGKPRYENV
jgi:alpha-tubulin suppressor-like RCC1 family protein